MVCRTVVSLFFGFFYVLGYGQELRYMPLEFQKAYKNQTRSSDGSPGINYWQNSSIYDIQVEIIPGTWEILGKQTITYRNNSPDSLNRLVIRMYPNHYKKGAVRANEMPLGNLTDGMEVANLSVDHELVQLSQATSISDLAHASKGIRTKDRISVNRKSTYIVLELVEPIPPNKTTIISMEWKTEMPTEYVNKIGAYDEKSAFVGYWYPQLAVYDDIDGWDENEYTGAQECYTDFAEFNVTIKVPKGNYVFATGTLQNPEQVLTASELARYSVAKSSEDKIVVWDGITDITAPNQGTTWKYKAAVVRDFAFGVTDNFQWIAKAAIIEDKKIASNIVYDTANEKYLHKLLDVQDKCLQFLSNELPGIAYPYDSFTTFMGVPEFDGMEFPMMANNGFSQKEISNNLMTFHELAHTYFPHWVGVNEVKYSWMEEGWATFLSIKFCQSLYEGTEWENYELERTIRSYERSAGQQWETPLFSPSNYMVVRNMHFQQSYRKPAFMYLALENLLGKDMFKKCLQTYISNWKEKHPTPYDFMYTFNTESGENLNWFWNQWVFGYGYTDVALKKIEGNKLTLENTGGFPVPVKLKLTYANDKVVILEKTAQLWSADDKTATIEISDTNDLLFATLVTDMFPDVDGTNNTITFKNGGN